MNEKTPNRVKQLRKEYGLTQEKLAEKIGVMRKTVSNWERGSNCMNPKHTEILAAFFKVSVSYLLGFGSEEAESDLKNYITYQNR